MVIPRGLLLVVAALGGLGLAVASCRRPSDQAVEAPRVEGSPAPQAANGDVIGADGKTPQTSLAQQATTDHPAPGWKIDSHGVEYDPKRQPPGTEPGTTRLGQPDGGTEIVPSGN